MQITRNPAAVALGFKAEDFAEDGSMIGPVVWITPDTFEPICWVFYSEARKMARHFGLELRDL